MHAGPSLDEVDCLSRDVEGCLFHVERGYLSHVESACPSHKKKGYDSAREESDVYLSRGDNADPSRVEGAA